MLDRDGTINRDHGWVGTRERLEWMLVRRTRSRGDGARVHVFVVTNQSGIARGYYNEADSEPSIAGCWTKCWRRGHGR